MLGHIPEKVLRGVIDDDHLKDMQERNLARVRELIEKKMGETYCCHRKHAPAKGKYQ